MALADLRDMRMRLMPIGQLITICPAGSSAQAEPGDDAYASRIEDHRGDSVLVSMPMRRLELVRLPAGSEVSVFYNRGGGRYHFRAVVGSTDRDPLPIIHLVQIRDLGRQERRRQVRVPVSLEPVRVHAADGDGWIDLNPRVAPVVNISAGGLAMVCRGPLTPGSAIHFVLDLPNQHGRAELPGEIVRCSELASEQQTKKWVVGVEFRGLPQKERDRLSAFVLHQQQLLRRRGLL